MISGRVVLDRGKMSLIKSILEEIPPELGYPNIEFEGPYIVIYVSNREALVKYPQLAQHIAKKVRKKIIIKVQKEARLPAEMAKIKIAELLPKDVGLDHNYMYFDEHAGEVWLKVEKPGLLISRNLLINVLAETGWRIVPLRRTRSESKIINDVLNIVLKQSEYRAEFMKNLGERIHRDVIFKNNYVRITALGGYREVGRSATLVETRESKVLLDFGVNVGALENPSKAYPLIDMIRVDELDAVIVTHAHLDHVGLVPLLYKYGYRGPVYVTKPTRDLMTIMIKDMIDVVKRSGKYLPYGEKDLATMLTHTITVDYEEVTDVAPDMKLTMYSAGHLLGSAIVHLHVGMGLHNIVYTGDFKFADTRLLTKAHTEFPRVETLIMESTYGASLQESRAQAEEKLVQVVKRTIERKGVVLVPVFAAGRGQEILLVLNDAIERGLLPKISIYVEGLVNEVTLIHLQYPEYLNKKVRDKIFEGENPFMSENAVVIDKPTSRTDIVEDKPSIIVATNGMLNGGPVVDYFKLIAGDPNSSLVFVGYQAEGTLGRAVKDGAREVPMVVDNKIETIKVELEVHSIDGFSGHSDQRELVSYVKSMNPKPKKVLLNHGEPGAVEALATILRKTKEVRQFTDDILTPSLLDSLCLAMS
ncbi:MAG: beta-CASP ribonuclease aCPSF1 [Desulfurococcaceae archaeon]